MKIPEAGWAEITVFNRARRRCHPLQLCPRRHAAAAAQCQALCKSSVTVSHRLFPQHGRLDTSKWDGGGRGSHTCVDPGTEGPQVGETEQTVTLGL
jgi:hypothetical protein